MDRSLLYVSDSRLTFPAAHAEVHRIIESSQARNATLGVTGTLVATRRHFAQILEGSQAAIDHLMERINADSRHASTQILQYADIGQRRFPHWTMAYSGPATYVAGLVEPLLDADSADFDAPRIAQLISLMEQSGRHED
jgi:hypothetical protein